MTYFFAGGEESPEDGERRELVPSSARRRRPTTTSREMSAREAAAAFVRAWREDAPRFGIINFANADMVGHTGVIPAAVEAVETVDRCLGEVVAAVSQSGGVLLITADHGNADHMLNDDGIAEHRPLAEPGAVHRDRRRDHAARRGSPGRRRPDDPRAARDRAAVRHDRALADRSPLAPLGRGAQTVKQRAGVRRFEVGDPGTAPGADGEPRSGEAGATLEDARAQLGELHPRGAGDQRGP